MSEQIKTTGSNWVGRQKRNIKLSEYVEDERSEKDQSPATDAFMKTIQLGLAQLEHNRRSEIAKRAIRLKKDSGNKE